MNLQEMTLMRDEELVMLAHEGNPEAVDFLMEKYKPLVRKKARALFLIGGENDDLIQEGMIALFKALREYDPSKESSFGGFASVCVGRHLCNVIKCANRLKNVPLNSYVSIYAPAGSPHESSRETVGDTLQPQELMNPEDILIDKENVTDLESAMEEQLSPFEERVVELYMDGKDYQQIAEILKKSAKSIDNALQRIKKKLNSFV